VADPVDPTDALSVLPDAAVVEGPPTQPRRSGAFRGRFLVFYGLLAIVLAAAIVGLVVVLERPGAEPDVVWSAWSPESSAETPVPQQIADYVGAQYRLGDGQQLVGIQAAPPRVQDVPVGAIATRKPPAAGSSEPLIDIFPTEETAVFILCGLGENCAIQGGSPSTERLRLLRRESLELALYTFRYVDGMNYVVAFLPPAPGEQPSLALFFRRGDLEAELGQPLRVTLPAATPPPPDAIAPSEIVTIDRLTNASLYRFQFQQLQDGTAVLVLNDPTLPIPETETQPAETGGTTTTAQ
jgi:hypothetical protein